MASKNRTKTKSRTFNCLYQRDSASCRVFCFPWAGGGSTVYAKWGNIAEEALEVIGIRIPGRESRASDPFATNYQDLACDIAEEIHNEYSDKPFIFFGHSMGLSLAYETARALKENYEQEPLQLILSGSYAPHSEHRKKRLQMSQADLFHTKSDEELLAFLSKTGTPSELLQNKEFMRDVFLPVFRADLNMAARYYCPDAPSKPFKCAITFIDGKKDADHSVQDFACLTDGIYMSVLLDGGHFYLTKEENTRKILEIINEAVLNSS